MSSRSRLWFTAFIVAAATLSGCAKTGDFPSLMPRPAETAAAAPNPETSSQAAPAQDPALAARLSQLLADAEGGKRAFEQELAVVRHTIARAGAAESESWIEAHLALSRLEASRTPTVNAAAEVDALALERSRTGAEISAADVAAIAAAAERIDALALAQRDEIVRLGTELSRD